jgi:hypothetical protein
MRMLTSGELRNLVAAPNPFPEGSPKPYDTNRMRTDRTVNQGGISRASN